MSMKYFITKHAADRWTERGCGEDLASELSQGVRVGAQRGTDYLLMLPCQAVAVVSNGKRVKTILTKDQAIVNMQSRVGSFSRGLSDLAWVSSRSVASLGELASRHAICGTGKAKRLQELRELCAIGTREHACYLAAFRAASMVMDEIWNAAYSMKEQKA